MLLPDLSKLAISADQKGFISGDTMARVAIREVVDHVKYLTEENEKLRKRVEALEGKSHTQSHPGSPLTNYY